MKPQTVSWWKVLLWSQILLPVIGLINWILNANYMYLSVKPIVNNPFLMGEWPWYIISIELASLLHFFIVYLPFVYLYHSKKVNKPVRTVSV